MKTTIKTIILAAASLFAAMSCQKETAGTQDLVKEGETIRVSINAGLGDFVAADATKATATPVVRLTWEDTDVVDAYCGTQKLNTNSITVTPSENGIFAKLSGEINATGLISGTSVITFVYSNVTGDGLTFDFSSQNGTIPFVAYATLVYDGAATLTDKMVEFKFATSVMKIAATNLDGSEITKATISGINTEVTLTPSESSETCGIEGKTSGTITKTGSIDVSSDNTRAIFTVGLVQDSNTGRKLTINGSEADLTSNPIAVSKSYTTPCAFESSDEYVVMNMVKSDGSTYTLKWAKKNLGASDINAFGELYSWGEVATKFDYSSDKYTEAAKAISGNLNKNGGYEGCDVAKAVKGGKWRMPTRTEFRDLDRGACGGDGGNNQSISAISNSDIVGNKVKAGKYWLEANQLTLSSIDELKDINVAGLLYSDGEHYLFFPAAGYSQSANRDYPGDYGRYWSSTHIDADYAYTMLFNASSVSTYGKGDRYYGRSIRPVSD